MTPSVILLAGPNGAGKTTASKVVLPRLAQVTEFVNADVLAQGLSGFAPEQHAIEAGRVMLARLRELAAQRANFAFEATLASRSFAVWIAELIHRGYDFQLFYFWVPSAEFAIKRVANRVKMGGHSIDPETIRRRYERGLRNFFELYQPLASSWYFYDNTVDSGEVPIASGRGRIVEHVDDPAIWNMLISKYAPKHQAP
ncbi:MAG TPA: zeta toxin family protein [Pirellulaceae bacterium]|nr:zeta toxin family protein [Pirellulaceae bacterium]